MSTTRKIVLPPSHDVETIPFADGEEAWFWFSRCQRMRQDGARFIAGMVETPRPCAPDDVYRAVMRLYRARQIDNPHLKVLGSYGEKLTPPDEYCREEKEDVPLWQEALLQLGDALKKKGIVE
ncbi:MAG: hypothetical protein HWE30_11480 [Methylocystaceae bacterium]|nr:hypothetical protein [Methylocystaceae bacterium]